jgi:hypothetical protein
MVTTTLAVPAAPAGVVALMVVGFTTEKVVAAAPPKVTLLAPVKFVPVMVTLFPPATGPELGLTEVTVGNGLTANVNPLVAVFAVFAALSATWMVKPYGPGVVGVPLKVAPERVKPGGSEPDASEKV